MKLIKFTHSWKDEPSYFDPLSIVGLESYLHEYGRGEGGESLYRRQTNILLTGHSTCVREPIEEVEKIVNSYR